MTKIRLKKDIIIKAGTVMSTAPHTTKRYGDSHFDCVVGLTDDSCGFFSYYIDDPYLDEWFEGVEEI